MIAVDTQILIYAHRQDSLWHPHARDRIAELANSTTRWGIPMHCLIEFYAQVTGGRLYKPGTPQEHAIAQIERWLEAPTVAVLAEDVQTWPVTRDLLLAAKIIGAPAYDARIAAICLQYGVTELWTNDRDFLKFPALRVRNPLIDIHPTRAGESRVAYQARTKSKARGAKRRS